MANITIRDLPDKTKEILRVQAAQFGVSLEAHVRHILQRASTTERTKSNNLLSLSKKYFGSENGTDLDLPERGSKRKIPGFEE
jgi:plasmid stability protein